MESAATSLWYYTIGRRIPAVLLTFCCIGLTLIGLIVLFSIGRASGYSGSGYFYRQLVWFCLALVAFAGSLSVPFAVWQRFWWVGGLLTLGLLLLVLIPGVGMKINGARRWIDLGPMNMQVSDFARLGFLLALAGYFHHRQRLMTHWFHGFGLPAGFVTLVFALLLFQPDFGTGFLFALIGGVVFFLAGVRMKFLVPIGGVGLSIFAIAIIHDPIRFKRILTFLDVEGNRSDGAYQLWQGILGFGVGGWNGVGLGNSRQQFAFLPEAHTDFIFPIVGEELGLVFTGLVALGFFLIFFLGWVSLRRAPTPFQFLFVTGALFFIVFQALINMGVATGCLPTKGMSLPFISYGGSNLLITYIFAGILVRACWEWYLPQNWNPREIDG